MTEDRKRALILGAGPVGLVSAWKLLESGWDVEVFEKDRSVGGLCKTWRWGDFLVDTGPHIFHTPDENLARFWEKEFGGLFLKGDFWCKNVQGEDFKAYWDYPLSWESISRYPRELKDRILSELKTPDVEGKARAKSYKEYMRAQVGETLRGMFFERYPEKIWGISTDEMTPDWAPRRIEFRQKVTPFYHKQWNAVGKRGTGCLFEEIRTRILRLGGRIRTGWEVRGLKTQGRQIRGIHFANGKSVKSAGEDVIISSLPITALAGMLGYRSRLRFRGVRTVYLAYDLESILPKDIHWFYYDSPQILFHRITEPKKLSPFLAPKRKTYLTAEITCSPGDAVHGMDAAELIRRTAAQVERVGLAPARRMTAGDVRTEEFVYPLQYRGYQEELAKTRSAVSRFQQIYSLGTGGEFHYSDLQVIFHKVFDTVAVLTGKDSSFTQTIRQTPRCRPNRHVSLHGRTIGEGQRCYVIAEAGLNHNGSLQIAKQLVDAAKRAGCDAVKFQTFRASSRISKKVKAVRYAETIIGTEETLYEMFDRLAMSPGDQKTLFQYARSAGIEIFSTPFDLASVDALESLGAGLYKIASMDLVNLPLIERAAKTGKPILLSTGMSTLGQIEEAVETVIRAGNPNLILLHCNSSYPAALEEMNLNAMETLRKCFSVPVGLSDHTIGLFVSQIAIARGADLIERHLTLDRTLEGPDHILSSEPAEFAELVEMTRKVPLILGDGVKRIQPSEYDTLNQQRKSLYAARLIRKGETLTRDNLAIKGPGGGLLPRYLEVVVGRKAQRTIPEDHPVTWDDI